VSTDIKTLDKILNKNNRIHIYYILYVSIIKMIDCILWGTIMKFQGEINKLLTGIELCGFDKIYPDVTVTVETGFNGLKLNGKDGSYIVSYTETADFLRAISLLIGYLKRGENVIAIEEIRKLDKCGVMIDCSRNAVPKIETLKDVFVRMAKMGLNLALLYTEDTYTIDEFPYFGYMRGKYTKDELKEIDKFALSLGIELVPCIQTLGHLDMALRWPHHNDMADGERTLLCDYDRTYEFIEAMLKTCRECFTTDRIHIGMDEAHGLGTGQFLKKYGYEKSDTIFLRHLGRVNELIKKYDYKAMMWDDMFFRYSSKIHKYYDLDTVLTPEIIEKMPKNISQVFWNYYKETNEEYEKFFKQRTGLENEIMFAGGIWTWYTLGICYHKTLRATRPALEECHKAGIKTAFGTMWDGGHGGYLNVYGSLLGMQLYAEFIYYEKVNDEHLKEYFELITGYQMDAFMALDVDNYPEKWCHEYPYYSDTQDPNVSKQVFYQDLLIGLYDKNIEPFDLKSFYGEKLKKLEEVEIPEDFSYMFKYHKSIVNILYKKCDMGIRIKKAYDNKDIDAVVNIIDELIKLKDDVLTVRENMYHMWHKEHKVFGWDLTDRRLYGLYGRIDTTIRKLTEFKKDTSIIIEELSEERLLMGPVNVKGDKSLISALGFSKIVTPALSAR